MVRMDTAKYDRIYKLIHEWADLMRLSTTLTESLLILRLRARLVTIRQELADLGVERYVSDAILNSEML